MRVLLPLVCVAVGSVRALPISIKDAPCTTTDNDDQTIECAAGMPPNAPSPPEHLAWWPEPRAQEGIGRDGANKRVGCAESE